MYPLLYAPWTSSLDGYVRNINVSYIIIIMIMIMIMIIILQNICYISSLKQYKRKQLISLGREKIFCYIRDNLDLLSTG